MRRSAFVGVDAGTSGCKAVLCTDRGRVLATATQRYGTQRGVDGSVTQDSQDWVAAMRSTVREVTARAGSYRIEAMSVTAPAHNAVLLGQDGSPLGPVVLWSDSRPALSADDLVQKYGEAFYERTLVRLDHAWTLSQLSWLRQADLARWSRLRRVLVAKDYLRFVLTDIAATDPTDAAGTALFDPHVGGWWDEACEDAGLTGLLPTIRPSSDIAGGLCAGWAHDVNLPQGLPVAVGATDTAAELLSVGATEPGSGLVKIASTGTVVQVVDRLPADSRLMCYPHATPGLWYLLAASNTATTAHSWLCHQLSAGLGQPPSRSLDDQVAAAEDAARSAPPGAGGLLFLPFLEGERGAYWDPRLRGAYLGLSSAHDVSHLCRSVMEGVAFGLRSCQDLLGGLGHERGVPALTGGGVRSALWRRILVSVLGQPGRVVDPHGPAFGAAMLAAAAIGTKIVVSGQRVEIERPVQSWSTTYEEMYALFVEAVRATQDLSHRLESVARKTSVPTA